MSGSHASSTDWAQSGVLPLRIFAGDGVVVSRFRNVLIMAQAGEVGRAERDRVPSALADVRRRYPEAVGVVLVMGPRVPAPTGPTREHLMKQLRDTAEGVSARSIIVLGDSLQTVSLRGFLETMGMASTPPTKVVESARASAAWLTGQLQASLGDFEHALMSAIRFVAKEVIDEV